MGGGADLSGADLTGANLNDTNLNGTEYDTRTIFPENFIIPGCMIFHIPNESQEDFRKRARKCKEQYLEE
jgi:hypothetical protein